MAVLCDLRSHCIYWFERNNSTDYVDRGQMVLTKTGFDDRYRSNWIGHRRADLRPTHRLAYFKIRLEDGLLYAGLYSTRRVYHIWPSHER